MERRSIIRNRRPSQRVGSGALLAVSQTKAATKFDEQVLCIGKKTQDRFTSLGRQHSNISDAHDRDAYSARCIAKLLPAAAKTRDMNLPCHVAREAGTLLRAQLTRANLIARSLVVNTPRKLSLAELRIAFGLSANVKDEPRRELARLVRRRAVRNRKHCREHEA